MTSSPVPLGEVFAGKYRVDRILGEGGMGIVVAAHHLELDQPVAIKFLLDDLATNDEGAERFRREARAAAKIQSDHVVRVLDVGVLDGGERYMVMEYMEGRDLAEELAEKGTLPVGIAAGIILEAIDAVGHAHSVGIVHRDLKPANLYLAERPDGSRRVKVLDFGISKSIGSSTTEELSLTKTSAWIGSPLYMAPEQMQSARDVDHRADIWSLGAILYEMVAGRPPYEADSLPQLCNLLITTDPEPIQTLVPAIPDGVATAIMNCLVRDRERRTKSTRELARALISHATSITGSALRQSLLDQAEFQPSLPALEVGSYSSVSARSGPSDQQPGTETVASATNAAWGATETGSRRSGGKLGWILAALGISGAVGFFLVGGWSAGANEADAKSSGFSSPVLSSPASQDAVIDPAVSDPTLPDPMVSNPKVERAAAQGEPTEMAASDRPSAPEEPRQNASGSKASFDSAETGATARARNPAVTKAVRPVVAPRPVPIPQPKPASDPQPSDDFADFGGRR